MSGRWITTRVDGVLSTEAGITSGVPQGSILGPVLFLIFFKDIPTVVRASSALFAYDTLLYRGDCAGDRRTPCCSFENDLDDLSHWAAAVSGVGFNVLKSAELCVGRRLPLRSLEFDGSVLPRVSTHVHLGVHLDSNLRWSNHVEHLLKSVDGPVNLCKSLIYRHHLPPVIIRQFYLSFVRPRLEYCNAVWCGPSLNILRPLERTQLQVACALTAGQKPHGSALLQQVNLPTLSWRRRIHCLVLLFKL